MSDGKSLESYIDKDKRQRDELQAMINKAVEFLQAHGYEVHQKGYLNYRLDTIRKLYDPNERKRNHA